jgi:class 3 adenylate cyclase
VTQLPGDRRQITVAFCDLVDSTVLAERLDPEELRDVVASYQSACAAVIQRWDGHIAQFLGDGILVYFGYPVAHEDDPQRAISAGLEIVQSVAELRPSALEARGMSLGVRIGVHTGLVVTSEIGVGERKEVLALGSTPNIGARLQSLAPRNAVIVSTETLRLTEGFFKFEAVPAKIRAGTQLLSGWRVLEPNAMQTRFELAVEQGLTPFQAREVEKATLETAWLHARSGKGGLASIRGEPGIGKSRLLHHFRELREAEGDVSWLIGRCSPFARDSAFAPLIAPLRQALAALPVDGPERQSGPTSLADAEPDPRLTVLAPVLGLPLPPESRMSPEVARRAAIDCAIDTVVELAASRAVVFCLEDLHWSDPSTLEVLDQLLGRVASLPVLVIVTARREFEHAWPPGAPVDAIELGALPSSATEAIVAHVTQGVPLPREVLDAIVSRTDGVPLFVEELTKAVLEHARPSQPPGTPSRPAPAISIPTTLQDSLMARLDRLSEGKRVAQLGAALGREFSRELVAALDLLPAEVVATGIEQLAAAELVTRTEIAGAKAYAFKHALIQDAAYASLLRTDRRRYHGRIADVLAASYREVAHRQPELIAHHLIEAGRGPEAIDPLLAAAQSSLDRGATTEAKHHLERARGGTAAMLDETKRWERELQIEMLFAKAARATGGYASPDVENAYSSALELSERLAAASSAEVSTQMLVARLQCGQDFHAKTLANDATQANRLFWILWGFGAYHQSRAELSKAYHIGQQLIQMAGDRPALALEGHFGSGSTAYFLGHMPDAEHHLRAGWKCFETLDRRAETSPTGHHAEVLCAGYLCLALWHLGFADEANAQAARALAVARAADHAYSVAYALTIGAWLACMKHDFDLAASSAASALDYAKRYQFGFPLAWTTPVALWAEGMRGTRSAATQLKMHIEEYRRSGQRVASTFFSGMLAEVWIALREYAQASSVLAQAQRWAEDTDERFWQPELYRLQAEVTLRGSSSQLLAAKPSFDASIRAARRQGSRSLEQRSTLAWAAHERDQSGVPKGISD